MSSGEATLLKLEWLYGEAVRKERIQGIKMGTKNMIVWDDVKPDLVDQKIGKFYRENGDSENILNRLFAHADNTNFDNVFCRVACIDSIYSTQIQRFNRNGIYAVSEHILKNAERINETILKGTFEIALYNYLVNVEFDKKQDEEKEKKTKKLCSFMSKFLSFSMPDVYPIMDSRVKRAIGFHGSDYEKYRVKICGEKEKRCKEMGMDLTLKQWDMFLWQWAKDNEKE